MAKLLKLRRGTTSQHSSFTGAEGEVTVDTTKDTIVVHDGSTAGGTPLAKESAVTAIPAVIDEDSFTSNSATRPPSQQSVGAYLSTQLLLKANRSGTEFTGEVGLKGSSQLKFYDDDDSDFVHIKSPTALTGSTTYVLPVDDGSAGQLLKTDGSGNLSWTTDHPLVDEDNMSSNSATSVPSQQSVKAYVDTNFAPKASPALTGTATGVNLTLSGNLTVNGTTTTINSTTLSVDDKNIELGSVSSPSDTTADGGGITLKGATDKTFNWVDATDAWTSSEHIHLGDSKKLLLGTGSDLRLHHDGTNSVIANTTGTLYYLANTQQFMDWAGSETQAKFVKDGAVELYHNAVKKIETTAAGVTVTGTITDDLGNVRGIPATTKSSAHTLVASDAGKVVYISTGGVTLPNSVMNGGDVITIINNSGSDQTLTQASGLTLYNTADGSTGNRTLAGRGMATVWYQGGSTAYISGAGLS